MLKFGASQHFQEIPHEPPGTERRETCVGDGGFMEICVVCVFVYTDMCDIRGMYRTWGVDGMD